MAVALNDNLGELLKRHPYHGVLFFAARCLCTLASHHAAAAATLLTLLRRFVALLEGSLGKLADPKRQLHARRGLFVVGQLTRFGSKLFAAPGNVGHTKPLSTAGVLALFLQYMEPGTDLDTKGQALQACGLVLIAHPALVLTPDGKMDGVLMDCLAPDAPQVRLLPWGRPVCSVRRQGKHTRTACKSPGRGLTNESEVSSHGNRRISAMCGWWCWAS